MSDYVRFRIKTGLAMYTAIVKFSDDGEHFELDVYDGAPMFYDSPKFFDEAEWIGGYENEPFSYVTKPVDLAKQIVEAWERPERLKRYLNLKNHFINMNEEAEPPSKATPLPDPVEINDYRQKAYQEYIEHLKEHPEELDTLPMQERKQLLKENIELRLAYHEWRAQQKSQRRSG